MTEFEKFVTAISWQFTDADGRLCRAVQPYGPFHLTWFAVSIVAAVLMCVFFRNVRDGKMRAILLATGCALILFEIYKQLVFSFEFGKWEYRWDAFPFQFCSTPMYAMVLAGALRDCKLRRGLISYLSTFSVLAGLSVMIFAGDIFETSLIGVCVQTMFHHGAMIAVGIWLMVWNRRRKSLKEWALSLGVFVGFEAIALTINFVVNGILGAGTTDMYYLAVVSTGSNIPVIGVVRAALPYPLYVLCYNLAFSLLSFCFYSFSLLADKALTGGKATVAANGGKETPAAEKIDRPAGS